MLLQIDPSQLRVSSVLNRDARNYGKKNLVDNNLETCWNSDQGSPQWIQVESSDENSLIRPTSIKLMFQGGFSGKECELLGEIPQTAGSGGVVQTTEWVSIMRFYPEDINTLQEFFVGISTANNCDLTNPVGYRRLRVVFLNSTDFYGRLTVYQFDIVQAADPSV
ncbi:hypothetical protein BASA50_001091 [Batrachochytrium salamandrivorans]|uniref:F5/8 type C domain-containing protein n=1 Tax=Batrachochytrium salamandrivorans TaxID=1357716 RepID=A0ABQ8EU61_9FUNG|nr:hypothetical protein BASA62_003566 [Batrachochytrium salamandrivorans]KAH6580535.1 hypothetical protein BASA60_002820 [Batrachochytrium salamandrivorans]KAH6585482.1 hypothetical protein BASA50_001091 [Batrachochytrium salamandrivorans]KAH6591162.1 hypothetical protein BASA61_005062 [Batrachochytrium salamandrivorans]KAH9248140.1 hypothetical protein BASA81_014214 [Batrachochytrium salamandrivorans]